MIAIGKNYYIKSFKKQVKRPDELVAEELFTLTPDALLGIIGFLRNYDGIVKALVVKKQYMGSPFSCLADRIDGAKYDCTLNLKATRKTFSKHSLVVQHVLQSVLTENSNIKKQKPLSIGFLLFLFM